MRSAHSSILNVLTDSFLRVKGSSRHIGRLRRNLSCIPSFLPLAAPTKLWPDRITSPSPIALPQNLLYPWPMRRRHLLRPYGLCQFTEADQTSKSWGFRWRTYNAGAWYFQPDGAIGLPSCHHNHPDLVLLSAGLHGLGNQKRLALDAGNRRA